MDITKVELVITKDGWEKRIFDGDRVLAAQRFTMVSPGMAKGEKNKELEKQIPYAEYLDEDLLEALDDLSGFDIAVELQKFG